MLWGCMSRRVPASAVLRCTCVFRAGIHLLAAVIAVGCGSQTNPTAPAGPSPPAGPPGGSSVLSITVSPNPATLFAGVTGAFTAAVQLSSGQTSSTYPVQWTSSNTAVATINPTTGMLTGIAPGTAVIQASANGVAGSANLTVSAGPSRIQVFPANVSVPLGNPLQNFTAYGVFPDGSVRDLTTMASWSSSNPAAVVSSGLGSAHTAGIGTANMQASLGPVTGSATVNVTPVPSAATLMLLPQNQQLELGAKTGLPNVIAVTADGTQVPSPQLTFASSNPNVVAIVSPSSLQELEGVGLGTATITGQGSFNGQSVSLSTTVMVIPRQPLYLYVADSGTSSVLAFEASDQAGNTEPLPLVTTAATGSQPNALAVDTVHRLVFVANAGSNDVSVLAIQGDGALLNVPGSPFPAGHGPDALVVDPSDQFVFVSNADQQLLVFAINPQTYALTPLPSLSVPIGVGPHSIYLVTSLTEDIYVANRGSNDISAYAVALTGALAAVPFSPIPAGSGPVASWADNGIGAIDGMGVAYVVNSASNDIHIYDQDTASGTWLPQGTIVRAGSNPAAVIEASTPVTQNPPNVLYVANRDSSDVSAFTAIDQQVFGTTVGSLAAVAGSPFGSGGTGPVAMALYPGAAGFSLYVVNSGSNTSVSSSSGSVAVFSIDGGTNPGALTLTHTATGLVSPTSLAFSRNF